MKQTPRFIKTVKGKGLGIEIRLLDTETGESVEDVGAREKYLRNKMNRQLRNQ